MKTAGSEPKKMKKVDDDTFEQLLHKYDPLITSLVRNFSEDFPSVDMSEDDLRQEAAIALYRAAISYSGDKKVTFGLYAKICIMNRLHNYLKRSISASASRIVSGYIEDVFKEEDLEMGGEPAPGYEEPHNIVMSNEGYEELRRTIKDALTDFEYKVIILTADGMSASEIAKKLGKNVRSVYGAIQRTKKKLKKLINK